MFWPSFTRWAFGPGPWDPRASAWNAPAYFQRAPFQAELTQDYPAMGRAYGAALEGPSPAPAWVAVTQGRGGYAADGAGVLLNARQHVEAMVSGALLKAANGLPLSSAEEDLLFNFPLPPVQLTRPRTGVGKFVQAYDIPVSQATDNLPALDAWYGATVARAGMNQPDPTRARVINMRNAMVRRAEFGDL